jgi:hypothetical protein
MTQYALTQRQVEARAAKSSSKKFEYPAGKRKSNERFFDTQISLDVSRVAPGVVSKISNLMGRCAMLTVAWAGSQSLRIGA